MRDIAIIGGAETLRYDLDYLSGDEIYVCCNHHWMEHAITPDILVYLDDISQVPDPHPLRIAISRCNCPTVSIRPGQAQHIVINYRKLRASDSGQLAIRWALDNFDGRIITCGITMRQEHDNPLKRACHMQRWIDFLGHLGPTDRRRIDPVCGPLRELLNKY